MKIDRFQLFADFSKTVDMYKDSWSVFFANSANRICIEVMYQCLDESLEFYEDEDDLPSSFIVELAMHYAVNHGIFEIGSKACFDYWNADIEGYHMPYDHQLKCEGFPDGYFDDIDE